MPEIHSKLSPSSAVRWLNCTPCLKMEEKIPDNAGKDAQEGTLAHSLGEKTLLYRLGRLNAQKYAAALKRIKSNALYDESMSEYINGYADFVMKHYANAQAVCEQAECEIEARLDFSEWAEGGFGTGDAVIITEDYIEVIDLKYGRGVPVSVDHNPQLMLYGLGAYAAFNMLFDISKIVISIYQPRINNIGSFEIQVNELLDWAENVVRPQAAKALKGEGDFAPSDKTCRFCKARAVCKARAEAMLSLETFDFKDPAFLSSDEIADILKRAEGLETWVKSVRTFAETSLREGQPIKGFKLVRGRSGARTLTEPDLVAKIMLNEGCQIEDLYTRSLVGIPKMEKLIGKKRFEELCGEYVQKPETKAVLAYAEDPREEYNSLSFDEEDFND